MSYKNDIWVLGESIVAQPCGNGVERKVMAYCDDAMCVVNFFEKDSVGPLHSHPHTQITYVAEGLFEFSIDGEKKTVRKGDTMCKRDSIEHGCVCLEKGVLIDFFTPMRDDFV